MIEKKKNESSAHIRSMSIPTTPQSKGLMYVNAQVNEKPTKARVDIDLTHNFVFVEKTKNL